MKPWRVFHRLLETEEPEKPDMSLRHVRSMSIIIISNGAIDITDLVENLDQFG